MSKNRDDQVESLLDQLFDSQAPGINPADLPDPRVTLKDLPIHVVVAAVKSDAIAYAEQVRDRLRQSGISVAERPAQEGIGWLTGVYNVARKTGIPFIVTVTSAQAANNTVSVNFVESVTKTRLPLQYIPDLIEFLRRELADPIPKYFPVRW